MLVLSRMRDQVIQIGDDITITIIRIGGDSVRLGIDAPKELLILRSELLPQDEELQDRKRQDV